MAGIGIIILIILTGSILISSIGKIMYKYINEKMQSNRIRNIMNGKSDNIISIPKGKSIKINTFVSKDEDGKLIKVSLNELNK